jgi:hypothetical protein
MKLNRSSALAEYKLVSQFGDLRETLRADEFKGRLDHPLAFWARSNDRRLPLAFMGSTVRELLATPFDDLIETPGVGPKKISSLMTLLSRVAEEQPDNTDEATQQGHDSPSTTNGAAEPDFSDLSDDPFDASSVSESVWAQWRRCVQQHGLEAELLGRFTPSLQNLPRVLWHTPLKTYTKRTLSEIRTLKTHGSKRVASVLEVFSELYRVLGRLGTQARLTVRVQPQFISMLEPWVVEALQSDHPPTMEVIDGYFVGPLLEQTRIDCGEPIAQLAEHRLGLAGASSSVRQAARQLGLTRARVYQLLADIGVSMHVRWPEGRELVGHLCEKWRMAKVDQESLDRFYMAADLFFPAPRYGVLDESHYPSDGHLEVPQHQRWAS